MNYVKVLVPAVVTAGALLAFIGAGTASATVLCSTTADPCPSAQKWAFQTADFSLAPGTSYNLKEPGFGGATIDTCTGGTLEGFMENGNATLTARETVLTAGFKLSGCTFKTSTELGGDLEVHKIAGTSNGTVTGTRFRITVLAFGLFTCLYEIRAGQDLGTLTEGKPAIFHVEAEFLASGGCPAAEWNATYTVTDPIGTTLSVSAS
jgi:hypothetical protein